MKHILRSMLPAILIALGAAGCASFGAAQLHAGDSEAVVLAKLGAPSHRYPDGKNHLLEYMSGPWGQTTHMARIGPDGRLISYEQVLTTQKFAEIKPGVATKNDVLHRIGAPSDTSYLSLSELEVWSYPYKESGVWDSIMHVHFDHNGIVRKMQNGPDLRRDPDARWPFSLRM